VNLILCVNDPESGRFIGRLYSYSVQGLCESIKIACVVDGHEPTAWIDPDKFRIGRRRFPCSNFQTWTGSWCCDSIEVAPQVAADATNHIMSLAIGGTYKFSVEAAPTVIFDKLERREPLTAADVLTLEAKS
jgi:hypothetical protein